MHTKNDFIIDLQYEIQNLIDSAAFIFDDIILPTIALEIDSIASEQSEELLANSNFDFSNFFSLEKLSQDKITSMQKTWKETICTDIYRNAFKKHSYAALEGVRHTQDSIYLSLTGKERKSKPLTIAAPELSFAFPDSISSLITEYTAEQRKEISSSATDFALEGMSYIPGVKIISGIAYAGKFLWDIGGDIFNSIKGKLSPEDQLKLLIEDHIHNSIDEDFKWKCRANYVTAIERSYEILYSDIYNDFNK